VIDLHTHLLPGVDDGSPTLEHSAMVLERLMADGVRGIVCTPHLKASEVDLAPVAEHMALLEQLRALAPAGMTLYPGWEIMLDDARASLNRPGLSLGSSRAVLVEWGRSVPPYATQSLLHLRSIGLVPLLAHVERYRGVTVELVREWRELGALMQGDATILIAGGEMSETAKSFLGEGLVDVLASDNHGDRRTLATTRAWLEEIGAGPQAELLTNENPRRVLLDETLQPVPPIRFATGVFARLRELFRRR
jgi:protein-tyrosine phosphatase